MRGENRPPIEPLSRAERERGRAENGRRKKGRREKELWRETNEERERERGRYYTELEAEMRRGEGEDTKRNDRAEDRKGRREE